MAMIGMALTVLGGLAALFFMVQILISAFKTSIGWGLGSLLVPFVILVYVFTHWPETKTPFLRWLVCFVVVVIGTGISTYGAISAAGQ